MEKDWSKIYYSTDFFKTEIVRQILLDNGVEAVLIDKRGFPYNIGQVEIFVHHDNFGQATELILANDL